MSEQLPPGGRHWYPTDEQAVDPRGLDQEPSPSGELTDAPNTAPHGQTYEPNSQGSPARPWLHDSEAIGQEPPPTLGGFGSSDVEAEQPWKPHGIDWTTFDSGSPEHVQYQGSADESEGTPTDLASAAPDAAAPQVDSGVAPVNGSAAEQLARDQVLDILDQAGNPENVLGITGDDVNYRSLEQPIPGSWSAPQIPVQDSSPAAEASQPISAQSAAPAPPPLPPHDPFAPQLSHSDSTDPSRWTTPEFRSTPPGFVPGPQNPYGTPPGQFHQAAPPAWQPAPPVPHDPMFSPQPAAPAAPAGPGGLSSGPDLLQHFGIAESSDPFGGRPGPVPGGGSQGYPNPYAPGGWQQGPGPQGQYGQYRAPLPAMPAMPTQIDPDSVATKKAKPVSKQLWRKAIYYGSGTVINPGESKNERVDRDRRGHVQDEFGGQFVFATANPRGGAATSTIMATLGSLFAVERGAEAIAIDANDERGNLARRINPKARSTFAHMLNAVVPAVRSGEVNLAQVIGYVRDHTARNKHKLDVLASDSNRHDPVRYSPQTLEQTVNVLRAAQFKLIGIDAPNDHLDPVFTKILDLVQGLVVTSSVSLLSAEEARELYVYLAESGRASLLQRSFLILSDRDPGGAPEKVRKAVFDMFAETYWRNPLVVPFDPHLYEGSVIDLDLLRPETLRVLLQAADKLSEWFRLPAMPARREQ